MNDTDTVFVFIFPVFYVVLLEYTAALCAGGIIFFNKNQ